MCTSDQAGFFMAERRECMSGSLRAKFSLRLCAEINECM